LSLQRHFLSCSLLNGAAGDFHSFVILGCRMVQAHTFSYYFGVDSNA
jgi:hypothetical protein